MITAMTKRTWTNPPIVVLVTSPNAHRTISTMAIVVWSVPLKNWTGNMNFSNAFERLNLTKKNSGRGQADDSLPGSGAGRPRLCLSMKGGFV